MFVFVMLVLFELCARWTTTIQITSHFGPIMCIVPTLTVMGKIVNKSQRSTSWLSFGMIRKCPTILGRVFILIACITLRVVVVDSFCYCTSMVKWVVLVKIRTRISTVVIPLPDVPDQDVMPPSSAGIYPNG